MIIDGRDGGAPRAAAYDILIVGAGPAGITLALELRNSGLRVGLLESGGADFDGDTQLLYEGKVTGNSEALDLAAARLRYLGGASNHWGGRCVPMDRIDFERRPLSGLSGWPIGYDDMQPFYERAHPYFDIGRYVYDPLEIGTVGRSDLLLPDSERLRTVVIRQSDRYFGPDYQDELEQARDIDLWFWTNVTGLDLDSNAAVTSVRTETLGGLTRRFSASAVVLACGAIESARLLLAHNSETESRVGNAGDLLGRCYMDHPAGGAAFLWPTKAIPPSIYWGDLPKDRDGTDTRFLWALTEDTLASEELTNTQFYLIPYSDTPDPRIRAADRGWRGLRNVAKWTLDRDRDRITLSAAYCDMINNADMMAADLLGYVDRDAPTQSLLLKFETEQLPERTSYVSLSEERDELGQRRADLHWAPTTAERDSLMRTTTIIGREIGAAGFGRLEFEDHFDMPYWNANTSWHQTGTTRMARRPEDGVVDPTCRVHGTTNLYIAGGGVMPTCGRANPTLTIVALSIRLADHLRQGGAR